MNKLLLHAATKPLLFALALLPFAHLLWGANANTLGINLYTLGGEDTTLYRYDTVHSNRAGAIYFMGRVWDLMARLAGSSGGVRGSRLNGRLARPLGGVR